MYDMADDDDYDKTRRISLTQAYRRNDNVRQPIGNRRIGINNGNHPVYKVPRKPFSRLLFSNLSFFRMMNIILNNNLVQPPIQIQLIQATHLLQKLMMHN
jgi:hypothetical protein